MTQVTDMPYPRFKASRVALSRLFSPSAAFLGALLVIAGYFHATGMNDWPLQGSDDEGTYIAQAWAVQNLGQLAHYTYWYDHPPLGWLTIALWTWSTHAFDRVQSSIAIGREFMLVVSLLNCVLLYALARRLGIRAVFALFAVAMFALSPLALYYHRLLFLDNIGVVFLLSAFILAFSPRRRLWSYAWCGIFFGACVLTKETFLVLLPPLALAVWQSAAGPTRRFIVAAFASSFVIVVAAFPLFAVLKGELIPGSGHVSLIGAIQWQLFERATSGSPLDPESGWRGLVSWWIQLDPWLIGLGLALSPIALAARRLRPIGLAFSILVLIAFRPGYLPAPYVIGIIPFAALVVSGALNCLYTLRNPAIAFRATVARRSVSMRIRIPALATLITVVVASVVIAPVWAAGLTNALQSRDDPNQSATAWLESNAPAHSTIVVDDAMWLDLVRQGRPYRLITWYYKLELDPEISKMYPRGWRDIDYIVSTPTLRGGIAGQDLPEINRALANSRIVASYADVEVRKVIRQPTQSLQRVKSDGLWWDGQRFLTVSELSLWLVRHGLSWSRFASQHPTAARGLEMSESVSVGHP